MKGFAEFVVFLLVALVWVASDWLSRNAQDVLFTVGLISIVIGCAFIDISLAFIVPGVMVCGLSILGTLLASQAAPAKREGKDA